MGKAADGDALAELRPAVSVDEVTENGVQSQTVEGIVGLGFQEIVEWRVIKVKYQDSSIKRLDVRVK